MAYAIDLSGQVAIVTGAAKGIGATTARFLAQAGAQVVIDDVVPAEVVEPLLDDLATVGPRPIYLKQDISQPDGAQNLVQETLARLSRVDILINNAGVIADWTKSFQVHVQGVYYCSEAVKDHMAARRSGRIVNLTSTCAFSGGTGIPQYVATKGGAFSLTRYLARTYAPSGILVNGVMPAVIMSDMIMTRYKTQEEMIAHYTPMMPVRRIGYPEDVAGVVLFLCSDLANFLCGEVIVVDGGRMHVGI
jgi:NAD(P)-dependent dehydrogenase (short-subunit alcohol dehydrogenase family)